MAQLSRINTIDIEADLAFQERQWRASKATWLVLVAVMVATLLGLFGSGLLSRTQAGVEGGPLWIEYDRIARFGAAVRVVAHARPQADGRLRITLSQGLLDAYHVERITPTPGSAEAVRDGIQYGFPSQASVATVIFDLQPAVQWSVQGQVSSPDATLPIRQFVLP